jgi:hypothetical protein
MDAGHPRGQGENLVVRPVRAHKANPGLDLPPHFFELDAGFSVSPSIYRLVHACRTPYLTPPESQLLLARSGPPSRQDAGLAVEPSLL